MSHASQDNDNHYRAKEPAGLADTAFTLESASICDGTKAAEAVRWAVGLTAASRLSVDRQYRSPAC
jgi:hypothetical protein